MKKSIFKRIVSAALALTMLASMAVGMSTSVSAATNDVPGKVYFTYCDNYLLLLTEKCIEKGSPDYLDADYKGKYVSYISLKWNPVANAAKYKIRVIFTTQKTYGFPQYVEFETKKTNYKLEGMPFIYDDGYVSNGWASGTTIPVTEEEIGPGVMNYSKMKLTPEYKLVPGEKGNGVYNISISAVNAKGKEGEITCLYESKPNVVSDHVPCMSKARSYTYKKVSGTSVKIQLDDLGLTAFNVYGTNQSIYFVHPTQGYKLTFTDVKDKSKKRYSFASISGDYKTNWKLEPCTVRKLEPGHTYKVTCQTFVLGYAGKAIYSKEVVNLNNFTMPK